MKLNKTMYNLYIKGFDWNNRRKEYIHGLDNNECEICFKNEGEHVHHQNYDSMNFENPGNELNEHLLYVCEECHDSIHTLAKDYHSTSQKDMDEGLRLLKKIHESYSKNLKEERRLKLIADKKEGKLKIERQKQEKKYQEKLNKINDKKKRKYK